MRRFNILVVEASGVETLFLEAIFQKRFFYPPITRSCYIERT